MHLELQLTNDTKAVSSARALAHEALRQMPLESSVAEQLEALAEQDSDTDAEGLSGVDAVAIARTALARFC